jgi:hypothetical protein
MDGADVDVLQASYVGDSEVDVRLFYISADGKEESAQEIQRKLNLVMRKFANAMQRSNRAKEVTVCTVPLRPSGSNKYCDGARDLLRTKHRSMP